MAPQDDEFWRKHATAPHDDEPLTAEDLQALNEARESMTA